ncbi:MAG: DUF5777 family beta-barrel protein [Cytophagales bacterium]|nr:DUF5777 family beta-barrel protein [Cytophagales bacterium]
MRILPIPFMLVSLSCFAQDELMKELAEAEPNKTKFVTSTFYGTRLVNGQTVETKHKGELEFIFAHRFGAINGGIYELFGFRSGVCAHWS